MEEKVALSVEKLVTSLGIVLRVEGGRKVEVMVASNVARLVTSPENVHNQEDLEGGGELSGNLTL